MLWAGPLEPNVFRVGLGWVDFFYKLTHNLWNATYIYIHTHTHTTRKERGGGGGGRVVVDILGKSQVSKRENMTFFENLLILWK